MAMAPGFRMRTDAEISHHIGEIKDDDFFGTTTSDLIGYLPWDQALPFIKPEYRNDKERLDWKAMDRDWQSVFGQIQNYMDFAWDKANNCRGLSAARSLDHMRAWLWMLGDPGSMITKLDDYTHYGKPQLRMICEYFQINWEQWDNGRWQNTELDGGCPPSSVPKL